jgi:hypothetical protein
MQSKATIASCKAAAGALVEIIHAVSCVAEVVQAVIIAENPLHLIA